MSDFYLKNYKRNNYFKGIFRTELIDNYLKQHSLTPEEFCKEIHIDIEELEKIYNSEINLSVVTLFKITRELKIYIYQIFNTF